MRQRILIFLLFLPLAQPSPAGNYVLTVDGVAYEISLDERVRIPLGDRDLSVQLKQKDLLTYRVDSYSFLYPREYTPSRSQLDEGLFQTAMMTPLGSVVMVQEYLSLDPSMLIDLIINEVVKEERDYGYKIESTPISRTLADGKVLKGQFVVSKYKGSDIRRTFYSYGVKDAGLIIMTQFDYEAEPGAEGLIDGVIKSLKVTLE